MASRFFLVMLIPLLVIKAGATVNHEGFSKATLADLPTMLSKGKRIVLFHDLSCGACEAFLSKVLEPSKEALRELDFEVLLVDVVHEQLLADRFKARYLPTIIKLVDGDAIKFSPSISEKKFLEFVRNGEHSQKIERDGLTGADGLLWKLPMFVVVYLDYIHRFLLQLKVNESVRKAIGAMIGFAIPFSIFPIIGGIMIIVERRNRNQQNATADAAVVANKKQN